MKSWTKERVRESKVPGNQEKKQKLRILAENYCISRGNFQQTEKERNTVAVGPGE